MTKQFEHELWLLELVWRSLTPPERQTWHDFAKVGGDDWATILLFCECKENGETKAHHRS